MIYLYLLAIESEPKTGKSIINWHWFLLRLLALLQTIHYFSLTTLCFMDLLDIKICCYKGFSKVIFPIIYMIMNRRISSRSHSEVWSSTSNRATSQRSSHAARQL